MKTKPLVALLAKAALAADTRLNPAGRAHAHSLIQAGAVDNGEWSFEAADGDALLGDGSDWNAYGKNFLAIDPGATAETKDRYKYPFAKKVNGTVRLFRRALDAIRSRAAQAGATSVFGAAGALLDEIDKKQMGAKETGKTAALRAAPDSAIDVDEDKGVLRNVALMTVGPARGHGFSIDPTTLNQVADLINASPEGVKSRFKHPKADGEFLPDDLGDVIGRVKNARIDGDTLRGDVHLGDYAAHLPGLGDVRTYLLKRAKSDPSSLGMSAVIGYEPEPVVDSEGNISGLVARVNAVEAVDFVGRGAATPNGLLAERPSPQPENPVVQTKPSTPPPKKAALTGASNMDPKTKQYLVDNYDLPDDASDDDAQEMYDSLSADDQAKVKSATMAAKADPAAKTADLKAKKAADETGADEFLAMEGKRVAQLQQLGNTLSVDASVISLAIADGDNVIKARTRYLKHLQEKCEAVRPKGPLGEVNVGTDRNIASLSAGISDALRIKAQVKLDKPHDRAREFAGLKIIDMGRHYLAAYGVNEAWNLPATKVWEGLFRPMALGGRYAQLAQSSNSFANITLDAANKTLRQAYLDAPATWTYWARRATAPDFKNINRIALSDSPGLVSRSEGGEIKFSVMADSKETYALAEYTSGIRLTRQAIINDDMDAFGRVPQLQGAASRRKEDDVCYAILTANAALSDTVALFHATHANLDSATANVGAPSVTTLALGRKALRKQTGPKGAYLNLIPRFLIVPAALEATAEQYTSANYVANVQTSINPFATNGTTPLRPIIEPRLDANSATAWYLAASTDQIDTVEVCFLDSEPEPVLKQEVDFDTDDVKYAVRHTVQAKAIDYRGLYKNNGA